MKTLNLEYLDQLNYDQIRAITSCKEAFSVVMPIEQAKTTRQFLDNENCYLNSSKSFKQRIKFFVTAISNRPPTSFGLLWNRALMDGFVVTEVLDSGSGVEFRFGRG
jgi:hypothetical protein